MQQSPAIPRFDNKTNMSQIKIVRDFSLKTTLTKNFVVASSVKLGESVPMAQYFKKRLYVAIFF
jgi:hypothetical protein